MLDYAENKGESGGFSQIRRLKNCAIGDTVAQLKIKWRNFLAQSGVARRPRRLRRKMLFAFVATFAFFARQIICSPA
jgi:hypothetical protein